MRDPDLVVRAQQAAAELERAWDRWRTMHGLGTDPMPPVSSYVGYSLEEPWGQPRVVFGIDAREAEALAALLDRHDCAGPVYASVASLAATRTADTADALAADADRQRAAGRLRVPTQAQPAAAQRERLPEPAQPEAPRGPLEPAVQRDNGQRDNGQRGEEPPKARMPAQEPSLADLPAPALVDDRDPEAREPRPAAFRPRLEPADYPDNGQEPDSLQDEPGQAAEAGGAASGWTRSSRVPGGHALSRQKRAARGASAKQEGRDRSRADAMAADLAGWTAGELPGQASH
jgi:hypothetical protein